MVVLQVLAPLLRSCSPDDGAAEDIFVPSCTASGAFNEVQCGGRECWCVDPQGREDSGSRTSGRPTRCPSHCERQQATALKTRGNMAAGSEIYVPACSKEGEFLPLQCVGARCFCVDTEGNRKSAGPVRGTVTCKSLH